MKIEKKLTYNNISKNIKRTIFTTISIILCTVLIFTTIILVSSIKTGIANNTNIYYNDYHFIIKNISASDLDKINSKNYIDKIYIQSNSNDNLSIYDSNTIATSIQSPVTAYIKYKNVNNVCQYSTDIIQELETSDVTVNSLENKYSFNKKLLTVYGIIDVEIAVDNYAPICRARVNYSFVINIIVIFVLVAFSLISIIILYNAFFITINERKKEYAVLNSVGATEGQILKIVLREAIIVGILGIIIGFFISYVTASQILKILNILLLNTGYNINLTLNLKYIIFSLLIIVFNIYISATIPCVKASTTSVIQGIKDNSGIKRKRVLLLEKIVPIDGKIAIKNIRRNKSKYVVITILLVICMTSYIAISTYINYEKKTADIVTQYDVDAKLGFDSSLNIDYKSLLNNYKTKYDNNLRYVEYKMMGIYFLVEPSNAFIDDDFATIYQNNKKGIRMVVVGLDDSTYSNYINKVNAKFGDYILYNKVTLISGKENLQYKYSTIFKNDANIILNIIDSSYNNETGEHEYEVIDNEILCNNCVLTNYLVDGFKDFQTQYIAPILFVNNTTYHAIEKKYNNFIPTNKQFPSKWIYSDTDEISVRINCNNIMHFSNYISGISDIQNIPIEADYFSLDNQEKIVYINVIQFILRVIIIAIIITALVSTINVVNASLCEREQDFYILNSIGATRVTINKVLIFEGLYMFVKSTIISIIISVPILFAIINYMKNIIVLDKLLIPFGSILGFFIILLLIMLLIMVYSTRLIKEEK